MLSILHFYFSDNISNILYGLLIGLTIFTIALGLIATLIIIVKQKRIKSFYPTPENSQCCEEARFENQYDLIEKPDMTTYIRNIKNKSVSLPDILDTGINSSNILYDLPAKSEGYLNIYQPLESGWKNQGPVYDKGKHEMGLSKSSAGYYPIQRIESNKKGIVDVHAAYRKSK